MIDEIKLRTFKTLYTNINVIDEYIENNIYQLTLLTDINNQLPHTNTSSYFLLIPSIQQDIELEEKIINELLYYDNLLKDAIMQIDKIKDMLLIPHFKDIRTLSKKLVEKIKIGVEKAGAKIKLLHSCIDNIFECQEMGNLYSNTYN